MQKIVIAITGASGSIYANILLEKLQQYQNQIHRVGIIMSKNAKEVWHHELNNNDFEKTPFDTYDIMDFYAPFASGSNAYDTMIIIPCSMGTLGKIASGVSSDLICRTADVALKERKKLICVIRETPLNLIHIQNMQTLSQAGAIICPANPSFYSKPQTIKDLCTTVVDRVLDLSNIQINAYRWGK